MALAFTLELSGLAWGCENYCLKAHACYLLSYTSVSMVMIEGDPLWRV